MVVPTLETSVIGQPPLLWLPSFFLLSLAARQMADEAQTGVRILMDRVNAGRKR